MSEMNLLRVLDRRCLVSTELKDLYHRQINERHQNERSENEVGMESDREFANSVKL